MCECVNVLVFECGGVMRSGNCCCERDVAGVKNREYEVVDNLLQLDIERVCMFSCKMLI